MSDQPPDGGRSWDQPADEGRRWEQGPPRPPPPGYGGPEARAYGAPPPPPYGGAAGYPGPYGYPPVYGPRPNAPSATTALVLGIIGIAVCQVVAPFAYVYGKRAEDEIAQSGGVYGGESMAKAGKILGIIGIVLLALGILIAIVAVIAAVASVDAAYR